MICEKCKTPTYRQRFVAGEWVGVDCGCMKKDAIVKSLANPFSDLTLEHIYDEKGAKVRVTSVRQLREAEQRYGFKHHLANQNEEHFNVAPQHRSTTVGDHYKRKFSMGA